MRFMIMHKVDAHMEAGGPPNQEIIRNMGALVQEALRNGVMTTGAGLHRSAKRARLERTGNVTPQAFACWSCRAGQTRSPGRIATPPSLVPMR